MSNETFFKCFKQNKIFLINVFRNLGVNTVFFFKTQIFFLIKFFAIA